MPDVRLVDGLGRTGLDGWRVWIACSSRSGFLTGRFEPAGVDASSLAFRPLRSVGHFVRRRGADDFTAAAMAGLCWAC